MGVAFLVVLLVGMATAKGSGPYAPRGWKPIGPAFTLPSEEDLNQKLTKKESVQNSLKEYGPPKLETPAKVQKVPEVQTARTFEQHRIIETDNVKEKPDFMQNSSETTTELSDQDLTTVALNELNQDSSEAPSHESQRVKITEAQIDNMTDLLQMISEKYHKKESHSVSVESAENTASLGRLREYGPPGFKEYGPPKEPHDKVPLGDSAEVTDLRKRRS